MTDSIFMRAAATRLPVFLLGGNAGGEAAPIIRCFLASEGSVGVVVPAGTDHAAYEKVIRAVTTSTPVPSAAAKVEEFSRGTLFFSGYAPANTAEEFLAGLAKTRTALVMNEDERKNQKSGTPSKMRAYDSVIAVTTHKHGTTEELKAAAESSVSLARCFLRAFCVDLVGLNSGSMVHLHVLPWPEPDTDVDAWWAAAKGFRSVLRKTVEEQYVKMFGEAAAVHTMLALPPVRTGRFKSLLSDPLHTDKGFNPQGEAFRERFPVRESPLMDEFPQRAWVTDELIASELVQLLSAGNKRIGNLVVVDRGALSFR